MKNIKLLIIPGALVTLTAVSGFLLSSNLVHADNDSSVSSINIQVNTSCTLKGGSSGTTPGGDTYTASIDPGTYEEIAGSKLVTLCNDSGGYSLYAIGYSGDTYDTSTNTKMLGEGSIGNINTGTSGTDSYWAMKLESVSGTTPPTILNNFDNYHVIPESFTQIAGYTATTTQSTGSTVQTKYKVNISSTQGTGIYTGKVKYTMVHPNNTYVGLYSITYNKNTTDTVTNMPTNIENEVANTGTITLSSNTPARDGYNFEGWCTVAVVDGAACTGTSYPAGGVWTLDQTQSSNSLTLYAMWASSATPTVLYDAVAGMTKGTMASNNIGINDAIVAPTAETPISSNSGVFTYNGSHSDAASTHTIYFYRGILDTYGNTGTYGSNGLSDAYPNYVVLSTASNKGSLTTSNTCWRIVRTTGSGGVKMVYNGKWTGSTCANSSTSANAVSSIYFNRGNPSTAGSDNYGTKGFITYVGYNYNNTYAYNNTSYTSNVDNSTLFNNGTASNLRTQLESWYSGSSSGMSAYTSKLETSAGWCNDRTTYTSNSATASPTTQTIPYKTSSAAVYFGAYHRLATDNAAPTLQCPNTTGNDLLTTSKGMSYPAAPLTADEAALAGSGFSGKEAYHANSYLCSRSNFWLLSPYYRYSSGSVYEFNLYWDGGRLNYDYVSSAYGVRPSISLKPGISSVNGSGIATDPWIVNP
ncbi:hypothetical protein IKD67_00945 [Candidatus Saccharibacteria bacterium]|nr:hypothetical protein [Candidatus Saccharibacteria bacterium]